MNIFALDLDPERAAQMLCDKHVVVMVKESAQILVVAHPPEVKAPYKRTHTNGPCGVWVRKSMGNYRWLLEHGEALASEYTFRYGKVHKSQSVIQWARAHEPSLPHLGRTPFTLVMPEEYKLPVGYSDKEAVQAYRVAYWGTKRRFAKWGKGRTEPLWWGEKPLETIVP